MQRPKVQKVQGAQTSGMCRGWGEAPPAYIRSVWGASPPGSLNITINSGAKRQSRFFSECVECVWLSRLEAKVCCNVTMEKNRFENFRGNCGSKTTPGRVARDLRSI